MTCKRDSQWFDAVLTGNADYVAKNKKKYERSYENRIEVGNKFCNEVHKGWTALQYACAYNYQSIFQILFETEFDLLTDSDADVYCQKYQQNVKIYAGSSIIHIIMGVDNINMMKYICDKMSSSVIYKILIGNYNDEGIAATMLCPLLNNEASKLWLRFDNVVEKEVLISKPYDKADDKTEQLMDRNISTGEKFAQQLATYPRCFIFDQLSKQSMETQTVIRNALKSALKTVQQTIPEVYQVGSDDKARLMQFVAEEGK